MRHVHVSRTLVQRRGPGLSSLPHCLPFLPHDFQEGHTGFAYMPRRARNLTHHRPVARGHLKSRTELGRAPKRISHFYPSVTRTWHQTPVSGPAADIMAERRRDTFQPPISMPQLSTKPVSPAPAPSNPTRIADIRSNNQNAGQCIKHDRIGPSSEA